MNKNDGFTLVEVVVSFIIICLLLVGLVTAFAAVRKVNTVSSKQDAAISLSSSLLESLEEYKYDDIDEKTFKEGLFLTGFDLSNLDVDYSETDISKKAIMHNIEKGLGTYKATIEIEPSSDGDTNNFQFPKIGDIASESTIIIDTKTMTAVYEKDEVDKYIKNDDGSYKASHENSYDKLTLYELVNKNREYITKLYEEECRRIDEENEKYEKEGIDIVIPYPPFGDDAVWGVDEFAFIPEDEIKKLVTRNMDLYTGIHNEYKQLDCYLYYDVQDGCEDIFGEDVPTFKYEIYTSKYLHKLTDLYIVYEPTDFIEDEINLVNGKDVVEDSLTYSLFFVVGNKFNDDYIRDNLNTLDKIKVVEKIDNFTFKYEQKSPSSDLIQLYTNYDLLDNSIYRYKKVSDMYKSNDKYVRLYDVTVIIEDENGSNLYSETNSSVLK